MVKQQMIYHKEQQAQWAQYKIKYQAHLKENNKMSNNIYNILGKLKGITDTAAITPDTEATTVYESVDARGSITEAVKSLEAKYKTFKEAKDKPDFLDVDKDGNKKEPFKKAVKDKKDNKGWTPERIAAMKQKGSWDGQVEEGMEEFAKSQAKKRADAKKSSKDKNNAKGAFKDMFGGDAKDLTSKLKIKEGAGPYTLDDPKHPKFKANYEKFKKSNPDCKLADFVAAMKKKEKNLSEAAYDEPAPVDADAVAKRKRLQALKDKQEDERAERGGEKTNTPIRKVAGNAYGGAAQKDDLDEGVQFGDKIDNSKAEMKKAKLAKLKESRVMEETDYFYEKVAKSLCDKNPTMDTASSAFADAVRKEMVAQGIDPNRARNILLMDEDFLMDVASSYGHYCKEVAECGAPMNSHLGGVSELDEIAQLAGLSAPTRDQAMGLERSSADELDEAQGVNINGKEINVGSIEVEGVNSWDRPDFADAYITYAEFMDGTPLNDEELVQLEQQHGDLVNQAAHDSLEGSGDFLEEEDDDFPAPPPEKNYVLEKEDDDFPAPPPEKNYVLEKEIGEGNEFSGALAAAKASGAKEFEVAGKRYTVKEDINVNITANGQEDALNLFRKLAGMEEVTAQPVIQAIELPQDAESAIAQGMIDAVDEERDPEYVNSPREQTAGIDAAIPSGNDLHATKRAYKIAQPGDNPMAVAEAKDTSWSKYTSMLKGLLK
jgi:hypothetical protein